MQTSNRGASPAIVATHCGSTNPLTASAAGGWPGGANFAMADGSVRFIADNISPDVLKAWHPRENRIPLDPRRLCRLRLGDRRPEDRTCPSSSLAPRASKKPACRTTCSAKRSPAPSARRTLPSPATYRQPRNCSAAETPPRPPLPGDVDSFRAVRAGVSVQFSAHCVYAAALVLFLVCLLVTFVATVGLGSPVGGRGGSFLPAILILSATLLLTVAGLLNVVGASNVRARAAGSIGTRPGDRVIGPDDHGRGTARFDNGLARPF